MTARQQKIADLHQRIYALPDFPDEQLEIRQILSDIVALIETNTAEPKEEA